VAAVVDICNLALAKLGDRANVTSIDPPEGSAQADHCARFYPIARDEALASADWSFASTYDTLAEYSNEANPRWEHTYALPDDFIALRDAGVSEADLYALHHGLLPEYELGTIASGQRVIRMQTPYNYVRFTRKVTDPTRFPPLFTNALIFLLASHLAGPVIKGRAGAQAAQAWYKAYRIELSKAETVDANQNRVHTSYQPSNLRARAAGGDSRIVERGQYRHSLPFWAE
jgi:hypothetical protein